MLRFLEAGFIAGARQLLAVILITSAVFLAVSERALLESVSVSVSEPELWPSVPVLLTWTYLLTAIGLALTEDHHLDLTAKRIRHATHLLGEEHPSKALASQLTIAAVLFACLALRPPPQLLIDLCQYAGYLLAAPVVWAGIMTTAVAFFGASAHAAMRPF
jgi:hypothetical protein